MKKLITFTLGLAVILTACDKGNDNEKTYTVTFEDAQLLQNTGSDGNNKYNDVLWGIELAEDSEGIMSYDGILYTEKDAEFYTYWSDNGGTWDSWAGFAISNNYDKTTPSVPNQFSTYASNSGKFAVGYYSPYNGADYETPTIIFKKACKPKSLDMAVNTWLYLYYTTEAESDINFTVTITGYRGDSETDSVDVALIKDENIVANWTEIDLSALGKVDKIKFTSASDDVMAPTYFCIDNLTFNR